jgi:DNA-binding NarL/FixJ family response regulator
MSAIKYGMSQSISIVEDDASVRRLLKEWIDQTAGFYCVSEHANVETALARLPVVMPAVVLMDINLPDATGIECVRRLKPVMPNTHFVMLTVYEDSDHIFNALAAGAVGYLLKLTPYDQLIKSIKEVCAGGSPMSSYIARKVVQFFRQDKRATLEIEVLSARERQVLELLARGYLYKEITESLGIMPATVNAHVRRIYEKLQVHTRTQAVVKYFEAQGRLKESLSGFPTRQA